MNEDERLNNNSEMSELDSNRGVQKVQTVREVNQISPISSDTSLDLGNTRQQSTGVRTTSTSQTPTKTHTYESYEKENEAKNQAELEVAAGVSHVLDDKETEDYVSTKELYTKTLGVTEYDELRAKLHLRDDESFTDYYNRTGYIPEGFEMQAKLLLAEEKRKKLYAEVEAGNMSEEDFLYEAYGKDLLKQEGIDFSSPLYWYQRYKSGDYADPRDNSTFMLDLIENARTLFQQEKWYEELSESQLDNTLAGYVTGKELSTEAIADIFSEQFDALSEYFDSQADIVKYYRAGLLQGFNPTIDTDGDGKIDYYLATDGKLYNVNETGEGANTYKAYYNDDGSLNRIVASDSLAGEMAGGFFKSIARFFTDVIDFGALIVGAIVDVVDGGGFGDTVAEYSATMGQFWNSTIIGDKDYIVDSGWKTSDGDINWSGIARQGASFLGTIAAFTATMGIGAAVSGASAAAAGGAKATAKLATSATKQLTKQLGKEVTKRSVGQAIIGGLKAAGKFALNTATKLTSWSNGAFASTSFWSRTGSVATLALKDTLTSVASLSINQERLGLSDGQVIGNAIGGGALNLAVGMLLRSNLDEGAINHWAKRLYNHRLKQIAAGKTVEKFASRLSTKITTGLLTGKGKLALGFANTAMDSIENVISAWTQTSLNTSGEIINLDSLGSLINNPQFVFNSLFQIKNTMSDEFKLDKRKLLGSIADTQKMDTDINTYIDAHIKMAKKPEDITALRNLKQAYDQDIKANIDAGMSKAEAILSSIEKLTTNTEMGPDSELITKWRDDIKSNIKIEYFAQNKAIFNRAKQIQESYNNLAENSFKGKLYKAIFNKNYKTVIEDYSKLCQRYIAIDIDERIREDAIGISKHYIDIFGKELDKYNPDEVNQYKVTSMMGQINTETDKDGNTRYVIGNQEIKGMTDEEFAAYQEFYNSTEDTYNRANDILIDVTNYDANSINGKINESAKQLLAAAYDQYEHEYNAFNTSDTKTMPLFIKLSDNKYIVRFHGEGNTALMLTDIMGVIKAIGNIKVQAGTAESSADIINSVELLFKVFDTSTTAETKEVLKDNINSIPAFIDNLIKNKVLTYTQAAKVYSAIKSYLGNTNMPSGRINDTTVYAEYAKVSDFVPFLSKLNDVRKAQKVLSTNPTSEKDIVTVRSFATEYLQFDPNKWTQTASDILKIADSEFLISKPEMTNLQKLSFLSGLPESLARTVGSKNFVQSLKSRSSDDSSYQHMSELTFNKLLNFISDKEEDVSIGTIKDFLKQESVQRLVPQEDRGKFYKSLGNYKTTDDVDVITQDIINKYVSNTASKHRGKKAKQLYKQVQDYINSAPKQIIKAYNPTATDDQLDIYLREYVDYLNKTVSTDDINRQGTIDVLSKSLTSIRSWAKDRFKNVRMSTAREAMTKAIAIQDNIIRTSKAKICEGNNKIVIDFNSFMGAEETRLANKLMRETVRTQLANAEPSHVQSILFTNTDHYYKYQNELAAKEKYKGLYSDSSMIREFSLSNPTDREELSRILKDFNYNLNGDILYKDSKTIIPGIYSNPEMFEGIELKSANKYSILSQLENKRRNSNASRKYTTKEIVNEPFAAIESWASSIPYITMNTKLNADNIVMNFLDSDFVLTDGYSALFSEIEAKLGKNAGALVKGIITNYSATIASSPVNVENKKKLFVYHLIDALGDMYSDISKKDSKITIIPTDYKIDDADAVKVLKKLYNVVTKDKKNNIYTISLKSQNKDKFITNAYEALNSGDIKNINYLIPIFSTVNKEQHNNLIRSNLNYNQTILGDSIVTYVDSKLQSLFDQKFVTDCLIPTNDDQAIDFSTIKNIDPGKFDDAISSMKGKTVSQILAMDSTNNTFISMQQTAIRAGLALSDKLLQAIENITINGKTLSHDEAIKVLSSLGNSDARRYIGMAIRENASKLKFNDNNTLIVTKELSDAIADTLSKMPKPSTNPRVEDSRLNPFVAKESSGYVTGQQLTNLNPSQETPDYSSDTIYSILSIVGLTKRDVLEKIETTPEQRAENLIEEFTSILKASSSPTTEVLPVKYLFSFTEDDFKILKKELQEIVSPSVLKDIENTIRLIYTDSELINKYDDPIKDRLPHAERLGSSINSSNVVLIDKTNINTDGFNPYANSYLYKHMVENLGKKRKQEYFLKLSSIDNKEYINNMYIQTLADKLFNEVLPFVKNKGSLILQNLNISDNLATLQKSLTNLSFMLKENITGLKDEDAVNLSLSIYLATTGMEYQAVYPEYIFYNTKDKKVINFAMKGSYSDEEDNLMATIYRDHFKKNEDTNKYELDTKNLIVIKADRNAFNSLYSEALGDVTVIDLEKNKAKIEDIYSQRVEYIKNKAYRNQETALTPLSNDEVHKLICDEMFNTLERNSSNFAYTLEQKGSGLFIGDTLKNIINDKEGLSFTKNTRTDMEELIYNETDAKTNFLNKEVVNSKVQKLRDAMAYGLDYTELSKQDTLMSSLRQNTKDLNIEIKSRFQDRATQNNVINALEELTDAINTGDINRRDTYLTSLRRLYKNSEDQLVSDVISYYVANTDTMDMYMLRLFDSNLEDTSNKIDKSSARINISGKDYTVQELKNAPKLVIDDEVFYGSKTRPDHVYQISLTYKAADGAEKHSTFYNKINSIQTMEAVNSYTEFNNKYGQYEGTKEAINAYLASDGSIPQEFIDILTQASNEGAFLIGYNSEKFDLPKLQSLNNPIFKTKEFKDLMTRHIDAYKFAKEIPTSANIIKHGGALQLGRIAKQLDSTINIDLEHNAEADTLTTLRVIEKLLDKTITSNEYKYNGFLDIKQLYKDITGHDITKDKLNTLLSKTITDFKVEEAGTKEFLDNIRTLREDSQRLIKTYDVLNEINNKRIRDYFDILERDWRNEFVSTKSQEKRDFAEIYSHKNNQDFLNNLISYTLQDIKEDTADADIQRSYKLTQLVKDLSPEGLSLDNIAKALAKPQDVILNTLRINREDFNKFVANPDRYNAAPYLERTFYTYKNPDGTVTNRDLLQEHSIRTAANSLVFATTDIYNIIQKLPIDSKLKDFMIKELYTYYDANADKPYRSKLEPNKFMNMISSLDKEVFNYYLTDPITNQTYESIYRLAQTVSTETVKINGVDTHLDNDMIAVDYQNFCDLFGLNPKSGVTLEDVKQTMGIPLTEDIMIPVIRHPMDKADSFHFLRLKVLDNTGNEGIRCAINIDTILTKMNGDLDGDHLSILRPNKYLQNYANAVNTYKNFSMSLLDRAMESIKSKTTKTIDIEANRTKYNIQVDSDIITKLTEDLADLNKYGLKNTSKTIQNYFKEKLNNFTNMIVKKYGEDYRDFAEEIYIQPPVDISTKISNTHRFAFYTDCIGMLSNKDNQIGKRLYQIAQVSDFGTLRYTDTVTGMRQKEYLTESLQNVDIDWIDNIIRLSSTTRKLIENNLDEVKSTLQGKIEQSGLNKKTINTALKLLNKEFESNPVYPIQEALVYLQNEVEKINKPNISEAIKKLKEDSSDTDFGKFLDKFILQDSTGDSLYNYSDIFRIEGNTNNKIFSSNSHSDITDLILAITEKATKSSTVTIENAEAEPTHYDIYDYKYVLYRQTDTPIAEDTFINLPAMKNNFATRFDEVYLSDEDVNYFTKRYKPNDIISTKDIKKLGFTPNTTITYRYLLSRDNSIGVSRSVNLGEQKLGTVGIGGVKGTPSGTLNSIEDVFNDCIILRPFEINGKKMTSDITKTAVEVEYYDANNQRLTSINGEIPEGTVAIKAKEPINIMEAPGLWSSEAKNTKLDLAAYGNNLYSTGGPMLLCGQLYNVDSEGRVNLDNSKYANVMKSIDRLNMPDRYEHNGLPLYQSLVLSTLLKNLDPDTFKKRYGNDATVSTVVNDLIRDNGFGDRMLRVIQSLSKNINREKLSNFDKAIISQELFDAVYNRKIASTPPMNNDPISSKNKVYSTEMKIANFETSFGITGDMAQMSDPTTGESTYISMLDLQNKIFELSGISNRVSKTSVQTLEANDLLNKGLATRRTQINPFPHNQEFSKDYDIVNDFNRTNIKRSEQAGNAVRITRNPVGVPTTDSENFDYSTIYNRSNAILNRNGSAFLSKYSKNNELTYGDYDKTNNIANLRLALLLQSINKVNTEVPYHQEFSILQNLDTRNSQAELSLSVPMFMLNDSGNISLKANRTYEGTVDSLQAYNILRKERTSPYYFDNKELFEKQNQNKLSDIISKPSTSRDLTQKEITDTINESIKLYSNSTEKTQKEYIESLRTFREFSTGDDVAEWASTKFYAGSPEGEHKQFKTTKLSLNQGIKLNDSLDLKADRVIKNFNSEAMSIAQELSTDYITLAKDVQTTDNFEAFNKFAYVLGMWNRRKEAEKLFDRSLKKDTNYKVIMDEIDKSIKNLGIENVDTFLKDFELRHPSQASTLYTLIKKVQVQAEKYSNLCNEPGQNIFFMLSPSVKNTKSDKKAAAKYMTSMLLHYTDVSEGNFTYDGYNILSSLNDTIAQVSRQASIYNNSQRLKSYGLMENTSTQEILYSIFNSEDTQKAILDSYNERTDNKRYSARQQKDMGEGLETYINFMLASENIVDANLKTELERIKDLILPTTAQREFLTVPEAYIAIFNSLNKSLQTTGISLEQALAEVNTTPRANVSPQAKMVVTIYNSMADVFSQLCYFTDDKLVTRIAEQLRASVGETKSLVDQYGRPIDKDIIYKLGDSSFEYVHDSLDRFTNEDRYLVTKAIKGELYTMDKGLATALADNVFIKERAEGFKKALQKSSSWCVKLLMSNPFKLIDRFAKFTAFDTAALSTANYKTLFKSGEAMADLRAFFASKGTVQSDNLKEFVYATGLNLSADNFDLILNNFDAEDSNFNFLKKYTDATGRLFTLQSMFQRYAYWLATKEALSTTRVDAMTGEVKQKAADYSVLGSAYYLKDAIKNMDAIESEELDYDANGNPIKKTNVKVSKEGAQAAFAMAQIQGSQGDFPLLSRQLSKYGAVFTTFPLAAVRWGIGEIRSLGTAFKNLFCEGSRLEGAKWLANNGGGIITTYLVENLMISLIADMFGVDDEQEEEWKEHQAIPNITQTLLTGSPIMDTFSSANIAHEFAELTIKPFIKQDEDDTILSGVERFFYKNILSHANPLAKNVVEVATSKDLIDDQVIDTKDKYNMWENVFRKTAGYIIGSAGANALIKELFRDESPDSSKLLSGIKAAVSAEVGNTKVYKSNVRNYYKALSLINSYIYRDSNVATYNYSTSNSFNTTNYDALKSDIYSIISNESKISDVYSMITEYLNNGYSLYEIRSAMKNCSIQNKLESIEDLGDFISSISANDLQNIKTALAFEQYIYPWLDEGEAYVDDLIRDQQSYSSNYLNTYHYQPSPYYTRYETPSYSNYFTSSNTTYTDYNKDPVNKYFNTLWTTIYGNEENN